MTKKYIVGTESQLGVTETEPHVLPPGCGGNTSKKTTQALWLASSFVGRWAFAVKRGIVEEFRTWDYGDSKRTERVFARELPADATYRLEEINAQIAATEAELKRLKNERQEFLAAVVVRAPRVKVDTSQPYEPRS